MPRSRLASRSSLAVMGLVTLIVSAPLLAQSRSGGSSLSTRRTTSDRQAGRVNASGGDFPSWERDVAVGERVALPKGRPGHHVPGHAVDLDGQPLGVVSLSGARFATSLAAGGVLFIEVGAEGDALPPGDAGAGAEEARVVSRVETEPCTQPPVALDANVLVTMGRRVARVAPDGILWTRELSADLARPPLVIEGRAREVACALVDGSITSLAGSDGATRWTARVGASASALAALEGVMLAALGSGDVVALDRMDGRELWRRSIGVGASALVADSTAAWVSGRGRSGRGKGEAPIIARLPLSADGRSLSGGRDWKLRVGGDCDAQPLLLDDVVAFTCHDGYVRAIDRAKGVGGWRTDLPARAWHSPLVAGGRLEFVLDQTRLLVVLAAGSGAVLGWSELSDEDEIFVGPAAWAGNVTVAATSLGRLVTMRWEWDEKLEEEDDARDLIPRP